MPAYDAGMSKLKMLETEELIMPLYLVPYAVLGLLLLTGTIRCGYWYSPLRLVAQAGAAECVEEAVTLLMRELTTELMEDARELITELAEEARELMTELTEERREELTEELREELTEELREEDEAGQTVT